MVKIPRRAGDKVAFQAGGKRSELLQVITPSRVQDTRYSPKPFLACFSKTNITTALMFLIYNTRYLCWEPREIQTVGFGNSSLKTYGSLPTLSFYFILPWFLLFWPPFYSRFLTFPFLNTNSFPCLPPLLVSPWQTLLGPQEPRMIEELYL